MLFSSLIFIFLFLPVVLLVYYIPSRSRAFKNATLLLVSLLFYWWGEPTNIIIMIASILINWLLGLIITLCNKKSLKSFILCITIVINLSILGYYKYFNFIIDNLNILFNLHFQHKEILLPIGISFFTFQAMSYVFDVYHGRGEVQKNPINVALYISFFPQLIAGPIVRYETIAKQIHSRSENLDDFSIGVKRFIEGLAKKVLLSNSLALIADQAFMHTNDSSLSISFAWLGAISYSLQIYYDFSGYSDMAIGLGKIFGFHFLENFNFPYISTSISEFWRRWHISLGSWFRDYVYFPLGGSKVSSKRRLMLNLFIVWSLTGIWHGANWTFVVWGLWHFVFIAFEKITRITVRLDSQFKKRIYQFIVLLAVVLGWVIFRSDNLQVANRYILSMFGQTNNALIDVQSILYFRENIVMLVLAIIFATPLFSNTVQLIKEKTTSTRILTACRIMHYTLLLVLFSLCVSYLVKGSYNPFIYFNF